MNKLMLFTTIFVLLSSCNVFRVLQVYSQTEDNETEEEISNFLKKKNYSYDESFTLIDENIVQKMKLDKHTNGNPSKSHSYIQLRVFDSTGSYHTLFSQCLGSFNKAFELDSFPIGKNNSFDFLNKALTFESELLLINATGLEKKRVLTESKKHTYTLVVYWNIWTKFFSKKVLKEVSNYKKKYGDKVYVVLCNSALSQQESNLK